MITAIIFVATLLPTPPPEPVVWPEPRPVVVMHI